MYNDALAEMGGLYFPSMSQLGYTDPVLVSSFIALEKLSGIQAYSDLHIRQGDINLGGSYRFTPAFYISAQAGVKLYTDYAPYVYGDQDGVMYSGSVGLGYRF